MFKAPEQLTEINKVSLETALRFAKISLDSAERMMHLQLEAAKNALEENAKSAAALSEVTDFQDLVSIRTKMAEESLDKALGFSKLLYEAATQTQSELSKLVEERVSAFNTTVASNVDNVVKAASSSPLNSDVALAAVKSVVATTAAAIDTMTKSAKQVAEFADANLKAAATVTTEAVKNVTKNVTK